MQRDAWSILSSLLSTCSTSLWSQTLSFKGLLPASFLFILRNPFISAIISFYKSLFKFCSAFFVSRFFSELCALCAEQTHLCAFMPLRLYAFLLSLHLFPDRSQHQQFSYLTLPVFVPEELFYNHMVSL